MALKDWRKNTSGRILTEFENYNTKKLLEIVKQKTYFIVYDRRQTFLKHFKTKSLALKFAKSYMRTH